jgi:uncharacterized RmlC-like cupin family protein
LFASHTQPISKLNIMPDSERPVVAVEGSTLQVSGAQSEGMQRSNALINCSEQICSSLMVAAPHSGSAVHHHADQDTVVYCASGSGGFVESEGGKVKKSLKPGDWCMIPAYKEHREVNEGDDDITWVIVRSPGPIPKVVNLTGWNGTPA